MRQGFSHFDDCATENFCAAILCLVIEVDEVVRGRIRTLIQRKLGVDLGELRQVLREQRLEADHAGRSYQRADVCLLFDAGPVLVELKTSDAWDPDYVIRQIAAQAQSSGPLTWNQVPVAVLLLAPTMLAIRVDERSEIPVLRWFDVISHLREIDNPLVTRALRHWEENVETTIGIKHGFEPTDLDDAVQRLACLRALLEACACDIGQRPDRRKIDLTGQDGQPFRYEQWAWHSVSVPLIGRRDSRIGIYRYLEVPEGSEPALEGAWLELYLEDPNRPVAYIPFRVEHLDPESLDRVRRGFREECIKRGVAAAPVTPDADGDDGPDALGSAK